MASKAANTAEATETREEAAEAPLLDILAAAIKKMLARGRERGYVTYDELNAALPPEQVSSEQIEDTMTTLSELGINVIEAEETDEPAAVEAEDADGEVRGNLDDDDVGRTDDPVRMYLREMGSVELLSREGEIAIAKRIEAGREMMIGGICENPLTVRAIVGWRDALVEGKMLLRDIIDLEATYGSAGFDQVAVDTPAAASADEATAGEAELPADEAPAEEAAAEAELAGIESELGAEDGEGEESSISLAAMEAQLKPGLMATFDAIAEYHRKLHRLQEQRIHALLKGEPLPKVTERRYEKLKTKVIEEVKRVRLNNTRIEHLVEQLYDLNRRLVAEEGRAVVLAATKWDAVPDGAATLKELREQLPVALPQLRGVALAPVSGLTGYGLEAMMAAAIDADAVWNRRVSTPDLNRWLAAAQERNPPPVAAGRRLRLRYITQANTRPPTFALFVSKPGELPLSYRRYLINELRESFNLPGTPIRLMLRRGKNPYDPR